MRSFEFVAGTSAKFWEIDRDGCDVTVRFGRVGTAGQTSVKTLADESAAAAHETRLINEKLAKGYVEASPAVVSEDAFVFPSSWYRYRSARRGSAGVTRFVPSPKARAAVDGDTARSQDRIRQFLSSPSTPDPIKIETRAWLDGSPEATPLGAAGVPAINQLSRWDSTDWAHLYADVWIAEHGLRFAAEAAINLMALTIKDAFVPRGAANTDKIGVCFKDPGDVSHTGVADAPMLILLRVRHALAGASEQEFAEVKAAVEPFRQKHAYARTATTVLFPDERAWFQEDAAAAVAAFDAYLAALLLTAASTPDDVATLLPQAADYTMTSTLHMLSTLVDGVGPAAAPALFHWFDNGYTDAETRRRLLSVLAVLPGDEVTRGLIERVDTKYVAPALVEHADRRPARALRLLAEAAGKREVADLLRAHVLKHRDLAAGIATELSPDAAGRIELILAEEAAAVPPAPLSAVPPVLADPPWKRATKPVKPVVVTGLTCDDPAALDWPEGEHERWAKTQIHRYGGDREWESYASQVSTTHLSAREAALLFLDAPEETARQAMAAWDPSDTWSAGTYMRPVAARFGLDTLPLLLRLARRAPTEMASLMPPFRDPAIAVLAADWLARLKSVRADALEWLLRHPSTAARALIPPALGKAGKARQQAENALLTLHTHGHSEAVRTAAGGYGTEAAAAIETLLATDPLSLVTTKVPAAPAWADPNLLHPVLLRDGAGSLPGEAVTNLVTVLAMSRLDTPYPAVDRVRAACEPESLAAFAWSLFERWQASGALSKENWVLDALGLLGDDETVRRLAPLILAWPGDGGHAKAVTGLQVLAGIGSDVALMHLHGIAQRAKFTGLKNAARQKMDEVAAGLGLTAEQLADRLVPDLGLDADGSLRLDYGSRQFTVGFDEQLRPFVTDADGKRLKALPKPGARDDAELAPAAYKRFAALKKDVRTIAADQVRRLERAMVTNRRWSAADFRRLFIDHPLIWHIVRRLVWVTFDADGAPTGSFRVAEDRSLSTVDDEATTPPDDAVIGLAHPLHLGDAVAAWGEVFADYEILQPFPQLARPVHTLTDQERTGTRLARFERLKVPTTKVLGLERRGWRREAPQDAGVQGAIEFVVAPGLEMVVELNPGIAIGALDVFPDQELEHVYLHDGTSNRWRDEGRLTLDRLDPVVASEILRDLEELTRP
ncbi:DUF4132 domain-containing protein [Actinoplanes flavus]|uniref:DUF4132 domain-containing protein n=1 Tax=Actinoplanes flavus TaxID=2820290 RepID=A0ABS3UMT5_9ACTN|nr:DUF4132 domain-containing protein [Actinoplanes flavus]MBO3739546.1 DUF4132 domain-containing protein [Actinoplanes flavus]